mmetsp:Transcript_41855/g.107102  ORF Transcript_41855/g.107102 Transcript_41855/m.107102 type:complete len:235 (-) Transcript_41855:3-707(-)
MLSEYDTSGSVFATFVLAVFGLGPSCGASLLTACAASVGVFVESVLDSTVSTAAAAWGAAAGEASSSAAAKVTARDFLACALPAGHDTRCLRGGSCLLERPARATWIWEGVSRRLWQRRPPARQFRAAEAMPQSLGYTEKTCLFLGGTCQRRLPRLRLCRLLSQGAQPQPQFHLLAISSRAAVGVSKRAACAGRKRVSKLESSACAEPSCALLAAAGQTMYLVFPPQGQDDWQQ